MDVMLVAQGVLALVFLFVGGESVIRGAASLASALGVSTLAIGLTVVAFGTSTPELVVSMGAALTGANDIAVGNVVGSNIANVALILGLAACIRPLGVHAKVVRFDLPLMVLASIVLVVVFVDALASRPEGVLLLLGLVVYTAYTFHEAAGEAPDVKAEFEGVAPTGRPKVVGSVVAVAVGLGVLLLGAKLLVETAVQVAGALGVSEAVIGLTIVAVGTSLPEAVATVVATIRGHGDIAVGNVVGSNLFNILGIIGATSIVTPLRSGAITAVDLWVMVLLSAGVAGTLLWRSRLGRAEGAALLTVFVVYSFWVVQGVR